MNRVRVISIGTSLSDERLAKIIRTGIATAHAVDGRAIAMLEKQRESRVSKGMCVKSIEETIKQRAESEATLLSIGYDITAPRPDSYAMMEVGTCHITEDDSNVLAYMSEHNAKDDRYPLNVGNLGYGFAIMLMVDHANDDDLDMGEAEKECELLGCNLSKAFWNILRTAKAGGYRCVYIDQDVPAHDDLEVFEW